VQAKQLVQEFHRPFLVTAPTAPSKAGTGVFLVAEDADRPQAGAAGVQQVMRSRHPKQAGADVATRVDVHRPQAVRTGIATASCRDARILRCAHGSVNAASGIAASPRERARSEAVVRDAPG
jgi:hypothetical protein